MRKEIIISIIIIVGIIIADFGLQKYTDRKMESINNKLTELKESVNDSENFDMGKIEEIENEWEESFKVITCYLEHDELEKINTQLVIISAGMKVNDKEYVYEEIDRAIYIISHVEKKQLFEFDNIL